jgi:hypothetical protein
MLIASIPSGHVITGDLNIIQHESLRKVISHGPKFRESQHINWKQAIGDNGNRLIFEIWWNFFYDLFSIKNVDDVNSIDSFVSKRNMEEC